jgi:hypothetical protein
MPSSLPSPSTTNLFCWNCQKPIPEERWKLGPMQRVFCSEECERAFHSFKARVEYTGELGLYEE